MRVDLVLFHAIVAVLLAIDLWVLPRSRYADSARAAWAWTGFLGLVAGGFAGLIAAQMGRQPALEFVSGYLVEGSLSIDNLFVFLLLFRALRLRREQERRVLFWGVLGAIVLRGLFILAGAKLLARFDWVQDAFGALLLIAAVRMLLHKPGREKVAGPLGWIQSCCLKRASGERLALRSFLLVVIAVEATDLIFAVDSIPAVLAITRQPFLAYTSNIFAILGLRSLYFAVAGMLDRLRLLHYGLGMILAFVALKMLAARWIEVPVAWSLAFIVGVLVVFSWLSLRETAERA